jgi:hypothetical protein
VAHIKCCARVGRGKGQGVRVRQQCTARPWGRMGWPEVGERPAGEARLSVRGREVRRRGWPAGVCWVAHAVLDRAACAAAAER